MIDPEVLSSICDRLSVLFEGSREEIEGGLDPISLDSVVALFEYLKRCNNVDEPLIGATPEGYLSAKWEGDERFLVIRFYNINNCTYSAKVDEEYRSGNRVCIEDLPLRNYSNA